MRSLLILMATLLATTVSHSQSGINPFDIVERIDSIYVQEAAEPGNAFDVVRPDENSNNTQDDVEPETIIATTEAVSPPPVVTATADELLLEKNPFEVSHIPIRKSKLKQEADAFAQTTATTKSSDQQAPSSNTFIFWLSLLAGVLLAVVINIRRNTITRIAKSLLNENILKYNHREEKQGLSGYYLMLYSVFFITASIFLYLVAIHYGQPMGIKTFGTCAAAILAAYLSKHLVLKCVGLIYPVERESSLYGFTIETFNIIVGLLLLPLNLIIAFGPIAFSEIFLYLSLIIMFLLLVLRSFRGVLIATSYIQKYIFHFFLYLCVVEIVPVLLLIKALI